MYGMDANFMRAQLAYDNAEPPDWDGEGTEHKECEEDVEVPVQDPEHEDDCANLTGGFACDCDVEETTIVACTFAGDVDVYYAGFTAVWTCPECDAKHEDDCEPEPPERDRDDY